MVTGLQIVSYCTVAIPILVGFGYVLSFGAEKMVKGAIYVKEELVSLKNRVSLSLQKAKPAAEKTAQQKEILEQLAKVPQNSGLKRERTDEEKQVRKKRKVQWRDQVSVKEWSGQQSEKALREDQTGQKPYGEIRKNFRKVTVENDFEANVKIVREKGKETEKEKKKPLRIRTSTISRKKGAVR